MTYQKLEKFLAQLSPEQKQQDVTIYDQAADECYPLHRLELAIDPSGTTQYDDVFEKGRLTIVI
jgi:hypothetical protein